MCNDAESLIPQGPGCPDSTISSASMYECRQGGLLGGCLLGWRGGGGVGQEANTGAEK